MINRRNFFKSVAGFLAGICAVFIPNIRAKSQPFQQRKKKSDELESSKFVYRGYLFTIRPHLWSAVLSLQTDPNPTHELMITLPFRSLRDRNILCESRIRRWKEPNVKIATNEYKDTHCRNQKNCALCDFNSSSTNKCLIDSYKIFV